jgi:hypothetical protein
MTALWIGVSSWLGILALLVALRVRATARPPTARRRTVSIQREVSDAEADTRASVHVASGQRRLSGGQ